MSRERILLFLAGTAYILLRWYTLSDAPFFDFDSVKNVLIAKEIAGGHFQNLFHHGTPLIHLFHTLCYLCLHNLMVYVPAIAESIGLLLLVRITLSVFRITSQHAHILAYTLVGGSFLMINLGRYVSLEPYTLLLFPLWLNSYLKHLRTASSPVKHLVWLGLLIFCNYKMLILVPFIGITDLIQSRFHISWKQLLQYSYAAWFIPFSFIIAICASVPVFKYTITLAAIIFTRDEITQHQSQLTEFSGLFYLKYLIRFEHPFVWAGLAGILYALIRRTFHLTEQKVLMCFVLYWLGIMSIFPAAPRGISLVVPLMLLAGVISLDYGLRSFNRQTTLASLIILILSVAYQLYIIQTYTYRFAAQHYDEMAARIQSERIDTVYTTLSNGIVPYLKKNIHVQVLLNQQELNNLPDGSYVLHDAEALLNGWNYTPSSACLYGFENPCKQQVMLALENAEYAGYTFDQAMKANESIRQMQYGQLCLFRIKK